MKRSVTLICVLALLLAGCSSGGGGDTAAFLPDERERLVIYTSHKSEVYQPIIQEFEQRTGIWVEVTAGSTETLLERIADGNSDCDLMFGGGADSIFAYSDCFQPYTSPESCYISPAFQYDNSCWTPFSALPLVLIYNPVLVRMNPPTGWSSLLDSAWKGSIAMADPTVSGSSYTALCTLLQSSKASEQDTLAQLLDNLDGVLLPDSGDVTGMVSEGQSYIGVTLEQTALKAIASGYDIAIVYPEEGTSALPDGAAIVKDCAHRENAELFIDFILSYDMQSRLPEYFSRRSVRSDVALPDNMSDSITLIDYDIARASTGKSEILSTWTALREANAP
jgi:iron(III) transport system substrate-binding protein